MKTAVIYARYSSSNQTEQSIEGQVHVCEDYAKRNDIIIVDSYIDRAISEILKINEDEASIVKRIYEDYISGKKFNIQKNLDEITEKIFDIYKKRNQSNNSLNSLKSNLQKKLTLQFQT